LENLPRTIAVVDDDKSMCRSVQRLLNAHGFPTEGYSSAESFLGRDAANDVVCIVLDIHLGGMSGMALWRHLRNSGSKLPVIFITAVDDNALEVEAAQTDCIACLHKPFPGAVLISAINKAMSVSLTA